MADRRRRRALRDQIPSLTPLLTMWAVGASLLGVVGAQRSVTLEQLFLDPAYLTGSPWYTGVLSDLGVLGWTAATVTALWGGWVAAQTGRPTAARFLRAGALVSLILLADDLLQLHADLLRFIGLPKGVRQLLIVAPAVVWLVRYAADIARTRWVILAGALTGFGLSLLVDGLAAPGSTVGLFLEDSAKLLGVLAWTQYMVLTSLDIMRSTIRDAASSAASDPPHGATEVRARRGPDSLSSSQARTYGRRDGRTDHDGHLPEAGAGLRMDRVAAPSLDRPGTDHGGRR